MRSLLFLLPGILVCMLSMSTPNQSPTAQYYLDQGELLVANHDEQKAFDFLKKAILLARTDANWSVYVKSLNTLASIRASLSSDHQTEIFSWLKEVFGSIKNVPANEDLAQLHFNVGSFYDNQTDEIEIPLQHFEAALKIWIISRGEWSMPVADCYHSMGDVYKFKKNDFLEAERCYEKALQIRDKIHFTNETKMTQVYYGLATTNRSQRDFEKALSYGIKALELSKKMDNIIYQEMISYIVANIYRDMQNSALAREYYLKAITLNQKRESPEDLASYYQGLGETLKNENQIDDALAYFQKSYSIYIKHKDKLLFAYLLNQMAETYMIKKEYQKSLETFRMLFGELASMNMLNGRQAYHAFVGIGDFYLNTAQNDSAIFYYQRALASVIRSFSPKKNENPKENSIGVNYFVHGALDKKAKVLNTLYSKTKDLNYLQQSLECLLLAEKLLSQERNTLDMEDSKWSFLEANYNVYEEIIATVYEMTQVKQIDTLPSLAFHYFEQSKARSLSDALIQAEQTGKIRSNDSLLRAHQELKQKLFRTQDNLHSESDPQSEKAILLREEIVSLDRDLQKSKEIIELKYPGYFTIKYGNFISSMSDLQEFLLDRNQNAIEYFWGNESVYALGISSQKVMFIKLGAVDSIRLMSKELISHFSESSSSTSISDYTHFIHSSHWLHRKLIEPFQSLLQKNTRLQIIPDGLISQIPFEVLLENKGLPGQVNYRSLSYLIKSHSIGYAYVSSFLMRHNYDTQRNPSLLAMGFTNGQRLRAPDTRMQEIIGSEIELKTLAKRFRSGKFLDGLDATEFNFKTLSPDFDIIHLAIHGKGNTEKTYDASLYFRTKLDSVEDGELHAYELYGLKLKAVLAVLTACESGLGKEYKGEGMISMASAFTYAGCENVLMGLWKVNDQSSIILMNDFYDQLMKGTNIDDALSQTKLKYIEDADEFTADPKLWASLVAYGKMDGVFVKDRSRIYIIATLSALTILLLGIGIARKRNLSLGGR